MPDGIDGGFTKHERSIMQTIKKHPSQNGIFICILSYPHHIIVDLILLSNHYFVLNLTNAVSFIFKAFNLRREHRGWQ